MFINEDFIKSLSSCVSIKYLFEFNTVQFSMFLATGDTDVKLPNKLYKSGAIMPNIFVNNLSSKTDNILVKITNIYNKKPVCVEKLLQSKVKIKIMIENQQQIKNPINNVIFNGCVSQVTKNTENNELLNILISPLTSCFNHSIGELFSPFCRECLGSKKCGINIENYGTRGKILKILSHDCFYGDHLTNNSVQKGYYKYGLIKFLNGNLAGICVQIKDEIEGTIYLLKDTKLLSVNDEYIIYAGCDKTMTTCKNKFNNIINFRGEPFIEEKQD